MRTLRYSLLSVLLSTVFLTQVGNAMPNGGNSTSSGPSSLSTASSTPSLAPTPSQGKIAQALARLVAQEKSAWKAGMSRLQRTESKDLAKLRAAATREARKVCKNAACSVREVRDVLQKDEKFMVATMGRALASTKETKKPQKSCPPNLTMCPPNGGAVSGQSGDCCTDQESCNFDDPPGMPAIAACVAKPEPCTQRGGSFCEAGELSNCCFSGSVCEVVHISVGALGVEVYSKDVPLCVKPPQDSCPAGTSAHTSKVPGGTSVTVCCNPNEKKEVRKGLPYCAPKSCNAGQYLCNGNPGRCCNNGTEGCWATADGPANCYPLPEPSPSGSPSPQGSPPVDGQSSSAS